MATAITTFETWFRSELLQVQGLATAISGQIGNGAAGQKFVFPYLIFTVFPLKDRHGQARTSVFTRLGCDVKFVSKSPHPLAIDPVIEAMDEHFRNLKTANAGDYRLSIFRENPISIMSPGAVSEEKILSRGSYYRVSMSKA